MRGQNGKFPAPEQPEALRANVSRSPGLALLLLACTQVQAQNFSITASQFAQGACVGDDVEVDFRVYTVDGYNLPVSLSYSSLPSGFFALAVAPSSVTPTVQGAQVFTRVLVGPGTMGPQNLTLRGIGANQQIRFASSSIERIDVPGAPWPIAPAADSATTLTPTFEWGGSLYSKSYRLQIATGDSFIPVQIVYEDLVIDQPVNSLTLTTPLPAGRTLFWRVQGENHCGSGFWSTPFAFYTVDPGMVFTNGME